MKSKHKNSRRAFLTKAGLAAFGLATLPSSVFKFQTVKAATLNNLSNLGGDYKALICLFQSGGNDSWNMLLPKGNAEYNEYALSRSNLALPQSSIFQINPATSDGKEYGVHPSMFRVQQMFSQGKLAFLPNIGMMIEPTSKADYLSRSVQLPLGLFSHADQIKHWQTSRPTERATLGWGGKVADLLHSQNDNDTISMNISLSGTNVFQYGENVFEYSVDAQDGSTGIRRYDEINSFDQLRNSMVDSLLSWDYNDIYKKSYSSIIGNARDAHLEFQSAIDSVGGFSTAFSDNDISDSFNMIAKIIKAQEILGFKRQIFFINYGGWDHHDDLLINQSAKLSVVSNALYEFNTAMEEIGMSEQVTSFTASEFGRTLTSNGNGSDHAWGGNAMVVGGAVKGGDFYGTYPSLALNGDRIAGNRGVVIPSISTDEYFAELALWFGVSPMDLNMIFPNIGNFYSPGSGMPIGFMEV